MHYSIVIPAFNEARELPATLAAVRRAMAALDRPGELIVVDNNSTDATADVARGNGADQVVFEKKNQIACARNAGAAVATGTHFIFVDADTRISAALLRKALEQLDAGDCVGGGAIVSFEGRANRVGAFGIWLWEKISKWTRTAAGSFLFCRSDAFTAVGGFDERFYAGEEIRLSGRLKRYGKARALRFHILHGPPALTSARKLDWYSGPAILGWGLLIMVFPVVVRFRRFCGFWYSRPASERES